MTQQLRRHSWTLVEYVRRRGRVGWAAFVSVIGPDEVLVSAGLVCLTAGLWPLAGQVALVAPALVLLWMGLPQRARFISGPDRRPTPKDGA